MDEVSFVETSSVLDETDISMNVSIGGADGGPDEDTLTPDSTVAESSTWADGGPDAQKSNTAFNLTSYFFYYLNTYVFQMYKKVGPKRNDGVCFSIRYMRI